VKGALERGRIIGLGYPVIQSYSSIGWKYDLYGGYMWWVYKFVIAMMEV